MGGIVGTATGWHPGHPTVTTSEFTPSRPAIRIDHTTDSGEGLNADTSWAKPLRYSSTGPAYLGPVPFRIEG